MTGRPEPVRLDDLSALKVETDLLKRGRINLVLVLRFVGSYRDGSEGNPDARFMEAHAAAALTAFDPCAVVLDLSALDYRWGDGLLRVLAALDGFMFEADQPGLPWFQVLGAGCRPAVLSLLGEAPDNERPDLATALADAELAAKTWP